MVLKTLFSFKIYFIINIFYYKYILAVRLYLRIFLANLFFYKIMILCFRLYDKYLRMNYNYKQA